MKPSRAPTTALVVFVAVVVPTYAACAVGSITMPATVPSGDFTTLSAYAPFIPFTLLSVVVALLIRAQPRNSLTWLLAAVAVIFPAGSVGTDYVYHWLYLPDIPRWPVVPLGLLNVVLTQLTALPLMLMPLVFPNGRLVSHRWAVVTWMAVAYTVFGLVTGLADPHAIGDGQKFVPNPLAVTAVQPVLNASNALGLSLLLWVAIGVAGLVSLVLRYRRSGGDERHQIKWFGASITILVLSIVGGSLTSGGSQQWTTPAPIAFEVIGFSALPVCVGVAILKYRLYDIDLVISRAVVYGSLAVFITAVYVGIVVGVGSLVGQGGRSNLALSIVATAAVAVGFQPLRERVQKIGNRLVYGKRATPYEVLSEFAERLGDSYASETVLPRMAAVLRSGTGAEHATVWLRTGSELRPVATVPDSVVGYEPLAMANGALPDFPDHPVAVPVRQQDEVLGALTVSKRPGESLTPIEGQLVNDLAHQAGLVFKNVRLTADLEARVDELRESRRRLVAAQDGARRRLERNLHDGAQQHLVAMKVKLGLAEMMATRDVDKAAGLLEQLETDTDDALATLRDLARGVYPPLLTEQGLEPALRSQARQATVHVEVQSDNIGRYEQEVEAAVYFCCLEALQNVQKYAAATTAIVTLGEHDGRLEFAVVDNGHGFDVSSAPGGTGLVNMSDRVEALGGVISVSSSDGRGTRVEGWLPARR